MRMNGFWNINAHDLIHSLSHSCFKNHSRKSVLADSHMTPTRRAFDKRLTVAALTHRARWFHDGVMTVYDDDGAQVGLEKMRAARSGRFQRMGST